MLPPFVKKFDFRGVYNKDITDKDAFYLGLAIQKVIPLKKILIGWDTRVSSMSLALNFMQAYKETGIEIYYLDTCPIDYVTAGASAIDFDFSVMFTGSHNPWDWTGLLMHTKGGVSVDGAVVENIIREYTNSLSLPYQSPQINLMDYHNFEAEIETIYLDKIRSLIPVSEITPAKVVVDIGDGSGSKSLALVEKLLPQVTFERLNDRLVYDSESPHTADPSNIDNMQQLMKAVEEHHADCGFAFDSDADRVLAVDETSTYINGSTIGSAMVDVFSKLNSAMKRYGYAVECGSALYNAAHASGNGVSAIPVPVGRSILRKLLREETVDIALENVGHFYIKDFFMTDSGAFALVVILYWMSLHGTLSSLRETYPDGKRTQFAKPQKEDQETHLQAITATLNTHFAGKEMKKITVDGIRYEFYHDGTLISWYAMRPSGYEPIEKYYFGSLDDNDYHILTETITKD